MYLSVPGGWINLGYSQRDRQGFRSAKLPWEVKIRYRGPLLIRARRLDGPAEIRFWQPPLAPSSETQLAWRSIVWPKNHWHGYQFLASAIWTTHPGCFGFQIDGTSFSEKLVVRVIVR